MSILLIAGSPSAPSRSSRLLQYTSDQLVLRGHRTDILQVRDLPAQALLHAQFGNAELKAAQAQVAVADAVIIATPVYKAAYSGLLKAFLDVLPQDGLAGKLVLPLATGGSQSHMLALDYALRPVLSSLSARHVLPSIYATDAQVVWSDDAGLAIDPAILQRLQAGIDNLSASLLALQEVAPSSFEPVHFSQVRCSV
ncbi:NADPH-dependent FMN reductase [Janthinobacterium sp. 17J80-10]|uniref:NADPH-dependent FMN reductase n=1 Tax=Janthinobacterium sp. 17J80-10 TaxID=2497863 RepID=UPI0010059DB4|nr:NADPH-dependent FMN reductase [Janthinobacterium sp. 17J80-10]QAU34005.1 FMN reductase (NADPH) [Janthinobacterium sp. 17J80-10]